jgi:hypothetical protein
LSDALKKSVALGHPREKTGALTRLQKSETMNGKPDPFEEGQRAARENIPAEANPYLPGSDENALWAAGHEDVAGEIEAGEAEGD